MVGNLLGYSICSLANRPLNHPGRNLPITKVVSRSSPGSTFKVLLRLLAANSLGWEMLVLKLVPKKCTRPTLNNKPSRFSFSLQQMPMPALSFANRPNKNTPRVYSRHLNVLNAPFGTIYAESA